MGVTELIIVRHGESTANVARDQAEMAGAEVIAVEARDADVPLSQTGLRQATALGHWFRELPPEAQPTAVWSSPYARARQTAHAVLVAAGSPLAVHVDERLRDKELGVLDTLTSHGIRARYPFEAQRRRWLGKFYYRAPGGESWADIALRLRSLLADLDRYEDGQRVLVVAHDAVVMLMRYVCEGLDEQALLDVGRAGAIVNTGVTRLVRDGGSWRVIDFNRHDHLSVDHAGADLRTDHVTDDDVLPG